MWSHVLLLAVCRLASAAQYPTISSVVCIPDWLSSLCCQDWTTIMPHWLVFLPICLIVSSLCWSIAGLRRSAHVTDNLASFRWLHASERIKSKLVVIVYRALHGTAPRYLSDTLSRVADISSRSHLRSSTSSQLMVRPSRLVVVGERSLASAGPTLWNSLPDNITTASSLSDFRRKLKTNLYGNHTRTLSGSFSRHGGP